MNPLRCMGSFFLKKSLRTNGTVYTFARLCTSRHLGDLQWIVFFVILCFVAGVCVLLHEHSQPNRNGLLGIFTITLSGLAAGTGAALNWAYQTGSRRLGMVDLFGCEISTICRVCLIVDFANWSVGLLNSTEEPADTKKAVQNRFASQEQYTPVYDRNLSELQPLDTEVVTHVTEFYTYRKTMMDSLRRMAVESTDRNGREQATIQMIYMQFLMYESGRLAIEDLIDFEPNKIRSVISILCSELVVYKFLLEEFSQKKYQKPDKPEDFRLQRLRLRKAFYENKVREIYEYTMTQQSPNWKAAQTTAPELRERFSQLFDLVLPEYGGMTHGTNSV